MLKDGKEYTLSLKEAVKWHRKMWKWIHSELNRNLAASRTKLKKQWLRENGFDKVLFNCFGCEYDAQQAVLSGDFSRRCKNCPFKWSKTKEMDSLLSEGEMLPDGSRDDTLCERDVIENVNWQESSAKEVAMLPINPRLEKH